MQQLLGGGCQAGFGGGLDEAKAHESGQSYCWAPPKASKASKTCIPSPLIFSHTSSVHPILCSQLGDRDNSGVYMEVSSCAHSCYFGAYALDPIPRDTLKPIRICPVSQSGLPSHRPWRLCQTIKHAAAYCSLLQALDGAASNSHVRLECACPSYGDTWHLCRLKRV